MSFSNSHFRHTRQVAGHESMENNLTVFEPRSRSVSHLISAVRLRSNLVRSVLSRSNIVFSSAERGGPRTGFGVARLFAFPSVSTPLTNIAGNNCGTFGVNGSGAGPRSSPSGPLRLGGTPLVRASTPRVKEPASTPHVPVFPSILSLVGVTMGPRDPLICL